MKLNEYFQQQRENHLSEADKFYLYEKIITKKTQQSFAHKRSFLHIKSLIYTSLAFVIIGGMYGSFFIHTNTNNEGFNVIPHIPFVNNVQADYIAQVVDFKGNFYIENDGEQLQTSNIKNNDTIILDEGTEMIFHIDGETQMKILGPAKFTINKQGDNNYTLNLQYYGDLIEIVSLQENNTQNIAIETPKLIVKQTEKEQSIKFQIIKENGKQIVKNQGSQLIVTKTNNKQQITTQVDTKQLLTMENNDFTVLSIKEFDEAIKNKSLSQTFKIFTHDENNNTDKETEALLTQHEYTDLSIDGILTTHDDKDIDPEIAKSLEKIIGEEKVLTTEQNRSLRANLNANFLIEDMKGLFTTKTLGDNKVFRANYKSFENKIQALYQVFNLTYKLSNYNFNTLKTNINLLYSHIQENYLVPPKYLSNLQTSIVRLTKIAIQEHKIYEQKQDALDARNNISNQGELIFK